MRSRATTRAVVVLAALLFPLACNAISGVGDYSFDGDGGGEPTKDAGRDADAGHADAGKDASKDAAEDAEDDAAPDAAMIDAAGD